jgi:hypothetical protein
MNNARLICSVSRGLLDRVTPNLRAVYVTFENDTTVLSFYFDHKPTEEELEMADLTDTEFISDFPDDFKSDLRVNTLPYPQKIPESRDLHFSSI